MVVKRDLDHMPAPFLKAPSHFSAPHNPIVLGGNWQLIEVNNYVNTVAFNGKNTIEYTVPDQSMVHFPL
jgi:hypothetical protein